MSGQIWNAALFKEAFGLDELTYESVKIFMDVWLKKVNLHPKRNQEHFIQKLDLGSPLAELQAEFPEFRLSTMHWSDANIHLRLAHLVRDCLPDSPYLPPPREVRTSGLSTKKPQDATSSHQQTSNGTGTPPISHPGSGTKQRSTEQYRRDRDLDTEEDMDAVPPVLQGNKRARITLLAMNQPSKSPNPRTTKEVHLPNRSSHGQIRQDYDIECDSCRWSPRPPPLS
jgi:hypothetical protein